MLEKVDSANLFESAEASNLHYLILSNPKIVKVLSDQILLLWLFLMKKCIFILKVLNVTKYQEGKRFFFQKKNVQKRHKIFYVM